MTQHAMPHKACHVFFKADYLKIAGWRTQVLCWRQSRQQSPADIEWFTARTWQLIVLSPPKHQIFCRQTLWQSRGSEPWAQFARNHTCPQCHFRSWLLHKCNFMCSIASWSAYPTIPWPQSQAQCRHTGPRSCPAPKDSKESDQSSASKEIRLNDAFVL